MIIDNKIVLTPPPPYSAEGGSAPFSQPHRRASLASLPPYVLLRVVHEIFPRGQAEGQRKILYWLTVSLRCVSRSLYVACMHVLRSTYLPLYASLIRAPYSSDPFPMNHPDHEQPEHSTSSLRSLQRETYVLDLFIALKVREDVWADDSELHLEREESFKDLFDLMQPRARLEDLVRAYGVRAGIVQELNSSAPPSKSQSPRGARPVFFSSVSVFFSPRKVGLVLATKLGKRTVAEVTRTRDETLEVSAKQLVRRLANWLSTNFY